MWGAPLEVWIWLRCIPGGRGGGANWLPPDISWLYVLYQSLSYFSRFFTTGPVCVLLPYQQGRDTSPPLLVHQFMWWRFCLSPVWPIMFTDLAEGTSYSQMLLPEDNLFTCVQIGMICSSWRYTQSHTHTHTHTHTNTHTLRLQIPGGRYWIGN